MAKKLLCHFLALFLLAACGQAGAENSGDVVVSKRLTVLSYNSSAPLSWAEKASYGEGGLRVPRLFQADFDTPVCVFNGVEKSVKTSGCGAVCLSMALAYLRKDLLQTPETLFRDACLAGLYAGNGLSLKTLRALALSHGVRAEYRGRSGKAVREALSAGYPVIAYMDSGRFSAGGHYIVLRGLTEDGRVRVNDPNSLRNSETAFDLSLIVEQSRSGNPFLVCGPAIH